MENSNEKSKCKKCGCQKYDPFGSLGTIEVAELTKEEIQYYIKETMDEEMVLKEISDCRKRLDSMGIEYRK